MSDKHIPQLYRIPENCCSCSACYAVCPQSAITMITDSEGFQYPHINENLCVGCNSCIKVCPLKVKAEEHERNDFDSPITYAVKHKDEETRMESRSGGIFTALSDWFLKADGVVYGCILDDDFNAIHIRAVNAQQRNKMRGSKYIQSNMKDCFKSVKGDLLSGKKVLFSGTSCQVAGLKRFLGNTSSNALICVDIVCHGVPSPMVWKDYLKWQEHRNHSKVIKVDFRNKRDFGWDSHYESLFLDNGKQIDSRIFTELFYGHNILRPSCFHCPYKSIIHPGDITIADYWGVDNAAPGFNDNKGVSLVLINNNKGVEIFELIRNSIQLKKTRIEDSMQPPLKEPFPEPESRGRFWKEYSAFSFSRIANKYGGNSISFKLHKKLSKIKHAILHS